MYPDLEDQLEYLLKKWDKEDEEIKQQQLTEKDEGDQEE